MQPLPCPFCGEASVGVREGSTFRWRVAVCNDCGAQAGEIRVDTLALDRERAEQQGRADALDAWNTRAAQP